MSEPRRQTELWTNVSKLDNKTPGTSVSPCCNDLQSPRNRGDARCFGFINGDSPGDTEPSQDIVWDSTSPTQTGLGNRNTRVVEISDIVNRIAPKNIKPKDKESSLLQWTDDGTIPYTPEIQKPRVRKRSSRQSSVKDLMKLARQFDQNMQQDEETTEQVNTVNNNLGESVNTSETKLTNAAFSGDVKNRNRPSLSNQVEAELHALFDCPTQAVSGRLSEGSVCSQDMKDRPETSAVAEHHRAELKSTDKCQVTAVSAKQNGTCSNTTNNCDDFDDDWENDDLLNDSFVLAVTQNPDVHLSESLQTSLQPENKTNATQSTSVFKQSTNTDPPRQHSDLHCRTSSSALQELCPKPKTTNRSTFKLAPNPHFQPVVSEEVSKHSFTAAQPKSKTTVATETHCKETRSQPGSYLKPLSVKDLSDSLWDDGHDDALLYQVCDSVERISSSQARETNSYNCRENPDLDAGRRQPVSKAWCINSGVGAKRQPACAFVRSNSLPETSCETGNYKGWNIPMRGSGNKSGISQSFQGSRVNLAIFRPSGDSCGKVQARNTNVDVNTHAVTGSAPQTSHLSAFKRNLSDSAIISSKVFVTSQKTGTCSAAEIERKKQDALARRRLRMQNTRNHPD